MISRITFKKDQILGDLTLDFTNDEKTTYNTIVLAGENGCGKTTILNSIFSFMSGSNTRGIGEVVTNYPKPFSKLVLVNNTYTPYINLIVANSINNLDFKVNIQGRTNLSFYPNHKIMMAECERQQKINTRIMDYRFFGVSYTMAHTYFQDKDTTSVITDVDLNTHIKDTSSFEDNFLDMFVALDKADYDDSYEAHASSDSEEPTVIIQKRIDRIKNAFNEFSDDIKFVKVQRKDKKINSIILKNKHTGKTVNYKNLSSGEKQILYRGTFLLLNKNNLVDGIVLIDEPEMDMHPKWQTKILNFYRKIFSDKDGKQFAQIFIATHSPEVIKSALQDSENCLIINSKTGEKIVDSQRHLKQITIPEINFLIFGIYTIEYHILLYNALYWKYIYSLPENKDLNQDDVKSINITEFDRNFLKKVEPFKKEIDQLKPDNDGVVHWSSEILREGVGQDKNIVKETLPTFIRNCIDHPEHNPDLEKNAQKFYLGILESDLKKSTDILIDLLKKFK